MSGLAWALRGPVPLALPKPVLTLGGEAVVGVALGVYVQVETVQALGDDLPAVLAVNVATLALTVAAGLVLARVASVDPATAAFGMIAGGASGIVAISRGLGADQRLVAVMQYLRVLIIIFLTPLLAGVLFDAHAGGDVPGGERALDPPATALLLVLSIGVGLPLARRLRVPAPTVLGPLLVCAALTVAGAPFTGPLPAAVQDVGFAVIGLGVGLRFTPESLRHAGRLLLPSLACIVVLLLACGAVGALLAPLAGVSQLDAYLATTPGGLYAVLAIAVGSGANTTFVLATQVLRLLVMLIAAPVLAGRLARRGLSYPSSAPPP